MRSRGQSTAHAEAVSRRLALLSAELSGRSAIPDPDSRVAADAAASEASDPDESHTRIRPLRIVESPDTRPGGSHPVSGADRAGQSGGDPAGDPDGFSLPEWSGPRAPSVPPAPSVPSAPSVLPAPAVLADRSGSPTPPALREPGRHAARRGSAWFDASAFRGRVSLTASHVAVLAVLAAIAMAITAWWVVRDDPGTPITVHGGGAPLVAAGTNGVAPGAPVGPDGALGVSGVGGVGKDPPATELVVDVAGKVRKPGIVVLPPGSRVVDAIEAAGGPSKGADLTGLNQARLLVDGEQVLVGVPPAPGKAASAAPVPGQGSVALVNLNSASPSQLEELPGVGPVTAESIVTWRETNGGFRSVDQLLEVDGIGEKTLAQLAPHVTL